MSDERAWAAAVVAVGAPRGGEAPGVVPAQRLSLGGLVLVPEMGAAGLVAVEGVDAHELRQFQVVGHAPRQLDRNIAVIGRVIEGIEHLSSLPRGTGDIGFYKTAAERTAIASVRMGTEVPDLPAYEYLSTASASFAAYADKRANRQDDFYIRPAGGVDACNVQVPVRAVKP